MSSVNCRGLETDRLLWVSPEQIAYTALKEFCAEEFEGIVIGGDWDLLEKRFDELDVYVAFEAVFFHGKSWQDTAFYWHVVENLEKGRVLWGCRNQRDFDARTQILERLFSDIKANGYMTQAQLREEKQGTQRFADSDEISVSIGRNGDLLFSNSAHRLAVAKLLKIERIPVRVAVRHPDWVRHVKRIHGTEFQLESLEEHLVNHSNTRPSPDVTAC